MKIGVIVATFGRAREAAELVRDLSAQTRLPDRVLFVVAREEDAPEASDFCEVLLSEKQGSCAQRNAGIDVLQDDVDALLFLDDDFVPHPTFIDVLVSVFEGDPGIVGVTGHVTADGVTGPGLSREEALASVAAGPEKVADLPEFEPRWSLYGCNMAIRSAALGAARFDEGLPLYGWLEDMDLTCPLGKTGKLVQANRLIGAHRGVKNGRTPGVRFGYSQIANPVHLLRKGTAPRRIMYENMAWNLSANALKSLRPEPHVDRRGRLRGNLIALWHLLTGRCKPARILEL